MPTLSRRSFLAGGTAAALLSTAGCFASRDVRTITLACGERGGSYLQFGELLASVLGRNGAFLLRPLVTEGSVENMALLKEGTVDLALSLSDTAESEARAGTIVSIGRVYQNYMQCVTRADSGIAALTNLAGKKVSLGAAGSGGALTAARVLQATGTNPGTASVRTIERPFRKAIVDLEEGRIDAVFWSGGIPTPRIAQLAVRTPVTLLDTTSTLAALRERYGATYANTTIPAGVYGIPGAVSTIGIPNLLLARPSLESSVVARLVDALIDQALVLAPPDALGIQYLTPGSLIDTSPIPLHDAAARRYSVRYG